METKYFENCGGIFSFWVVTVGQPRPEYFFFAYAKRWTPVRLGPVAYAPGCFINRVHPVVIGLLVLPSSFRRTRTAVVALGKGRTN